MPRAAALLDVQQVSDVAAIEGEDTFVRPIYAGNALATVKSGDKVKVLTIRATAFDAAAAEGGSAAVEAVEGGGDTGLATFKGQELTKSESPELTTASIVIPGGRSLPSGVNFVILERLPNHSDVSRVGKECVRTWRA